MVSQTLLIRADASARIGTGHVMRCLALAQAWRRSGGSAIFASAEITAALEARLAGEGFQSVRLSVTPGTNEDAAKTAEMARSQNASWVVADGYHFGPNYQQVIKAAGLRLLLLDDYGHAVEYVADLVLNQNLTADAALYARCATYTRLLLGTRYALLREEFLRWSNWKREIPAVARKVLVTLGGGDPDNVTGKVVQALKQFSEIETKVVIGGSNPHVQSLQSSIIHHPSSIQLVVDAPNMPELMAWADVAIVAGGSTSWELAFMGLPSLVLIIADNQLAVARQLDKDGVSINLGTFATLTAKQIASALRTLVADQSQRNTMSQRGRLLVDGDGAARIVTRLSAAGIKLRRADSGDSRLLWEWANDSDVRESAFSSEPIPWDAHQLWFAKKLAAPASAVFVARNGAGTPIGQIRFDWNEQGETEIDVSVSAAARRGGLGSALIRAGVDEMLTTTSVNVFHALVKKNNLPSLRAFEKAGFRRSELETVRGQEAWKLTLARNDD
jgi:UDP-2,4-diacetamido-2,4,6-trideoxy-beta-L-altropyranose hydrolase